MIMTGLLAVWLALVNGLWLYSCKHSGMHAAVKHSAVNLQSSRYAADS